MASIFRQEQEIHMSKIQKEIAAEQLMEAENLEAGLYLLNKLTGWCLFMCLFYDESWPLKTFFRGIIFTGVSERGKGYILIPT